MTNRLSPSILAADVRYLEREIQTVANAGAEYIHIDVMDGVFVPNISFGLPIVKGLRSCTDAFFDVHLMITEPLRYIERFAEAGADGITVHAEACEDLQAAVDKIIALGKQAGVAISPDTGIEPVLPLLDKLSMVLVMTVYPGYGGQSLIKDTFTKIRNLREIINRRGLNVNIEVDGGVSLDNVREIMETGANVFVAGTKVFRGDAAKNTMDFMKLLRD